MKVADLVDPLKLYSYKPGYTFILIHERIGRFTYVKVMLTAPVKDSNDPEKDITVMFQSIPVCIDQIRMNVDEILELMVLEVVTKWELHEAHEWLKFDGKRLNEPKHN